MGGPMQPTHKRLKQSFWALLVAIDILACTLWLAPLYALGLAGKPTGRQMISSYVGEASFNNMAWAKPIEKIIDRGARLFGDEPNHCYRAFVKYQFLDD